LILPSHGKAACIAAQVCSSWRTFIQCHLLQTQAAPQSLPNWCRRWQILSLSEANFAFATLSHIRPQILRFADIYGSNGERLSELDMNHLNPTNHINLGLPMDAESFRFFTELSFADDSSCWKNVALMELFFGDDLERMESWWLLVEHRLSTKPFGASILGSLRFGSSWQNLYHHASLLSSEVVLSLPHFAPQQGAFHRLIRFPSPHFSVCRLVFSTFSTMASPMALQAILNIFANRNLGTVLSCAACNNLVYP
jgi:hypothetical protein